jgi:pseudouridine synthase
MTIRLQKYLAERGVASRRAAAEWIRAGRVSVNGAAAAEPGMRIDPVADRIAVDGAELPRERERRRTILLHKPRGYVCSARGQGARTVYDLLPAMTERLVPAGRLDKDSEGLLVLSNDGELINRLTHPRFGHTKTYRVTVSGEISDRVLAGLRAPLEIDGYTTRPAEVRVVDRSGDAAPPDTPAPFGGEASPLWGGRPSTLIFTLAEGRNQQIRRLCDRAGLRVHRLVRTAFGPWTVRGLKPGQWREVDGWTQTSALSRSASVAATTASPIPLPRKVRRKGRRAFPAPPVTQAFPAARSAPPASSPALGRSDDSSRRAE